MKRIVSCAFSFFSILTTLFLASSAWAEDHGHAWSRKPKWANRSADEDLREERSSNEGAARDRDRRPAANYSSTTQSTPFSPGSSNLSLDVGQVFLMGDLAASYGDAIGSRLHYTYGVSDLFSFDSSLGYSTHSDGDFTMTSILTGLRTNLAWYDKVIPHATFGMGFFRPGFRNEDISPILFGVHVGAGVNLEITRALFFGTSLTYHNMFGTDRKGASGNLLPIGGSFTSFLVTAGVSF